jgi:hypothetical protein
MTGAEYIENERLRKAGVFPEDTSRYLSEMAAARRDEGRSLRGRLRGIAYLAPTILLVSMLSPVAMNRTVKICLDVAAFMACIVLLGRANQRAVQIRLDLKKRTED